MTGSVNTNFNNQKYNVGVIVPPDKINRYILYSDKEAVQNIKKANHDVYVTRKKQDFGDRYKTPASVWYTLGTIALAGVGFAVKKLLKK